MLNHPYFKSALHLFGLLVGLVAHADGASAVWPNPVELKAGQHVHIPQEYGDFELSFLVKVEDGLRLDLPRGARIEFERKGDRRGRVEEQAPDGAAIPLVGWSVGGMADEAGNTVRMVRVGSVTDLWVDGVWVSGADLLGNTVHGGGWDGMAKTGHVVFEAWGGSVELDHVLVRELSSEESADYLSDRGIPGRRALPITPAMKGWGGATEAVAVDGDQMTWKVGERGQILYWDEPLRDFEFEFQFNLSPAANNGVVLRYAGTGRAIYASMCELQILDEDYPALRRKPLDPRQTHGSAYGLAAARQGYQRPVGAWNHQKIMVRGSRIVVELNGTTILDANLEAIPEAEIMGGKRLPGFARSEGFVGFAGHADPVSFKKIFVRKL